jgi:DUF4097 and DUF4098 domain-containing protein YvlB
LGAGGVLPGNFASGDPMYILSFVSSLSFAGSPDPCGQSSDDGRAHACVVRELSLPVTSGLTVDARTNGGIEVSGQDAGGIRVTAKIATSARTDAQAEALADAVKIVTTSGRIAADGPTRVRGEDWSVSFEIAAPRKTDLSLLTYNGGLSVVGMDSTISLSSTNGGISLEDVNGAVTGSTTNGGVHVELFGTGWRGTGLDVRTTNGGISVALPRTYAAELDVGTVNGGVSVEAPSERHEGGRVKASLGGGGAPIRLTTTNGAVSVAAN